MPWCDTCAKFWNPPTLPDGHCPACGAELEGPAEPGDEPVPHAPWHFKLLLVALVLYLAFRAYQGVFWVIHHV